MHLHLGESPPCRIHYPEETPMTVTVSKGTNRLAAAAKTAKAAQRTRSPATRRPPTCSLRSGSTRSTTTTTADGMSSWRPGTTRSWPRRSRAPAP